MMDLRGCGTALVTPFTASGGIDEPALIRHVNWQIENGIHFLVSVGTTGEAPTLTDEEWLEVVDLTVRTAAGRVPVIAGCTEHCTRLAVELITRLSAVPNLTGILTANPYYNKPSQLGQYLHFKAIAEATHLPIVLYNIPGRTGVNLEPATVLRLAEVPNIVAIKESSGNLTQIGDLITSLAAAGHSGFNVLAGDDALTVPVMRLGGTGIISVISNELPARMAALASHALAGNWLAAETDSAELAPLMAANFWEPSPGPVKAVLAMMGRLTESLRLPMTPVTDPTRARLHAIAAEYGLIQK
jgi:4-hydroxy-tetrahydrodipicolinate synthase